MAEIVAVRRKVVVDLGCTKAKAIVLGSFAAWAVLCVCLTLIGTAYFFLAIINLDDNRRGEAFWGSTMFLRVALALSLVVAFRCGRRVARDWYGVGRLRLPTGSK
jgi:cell division protein FtsW (lipid II flippase)